MESWAAADTEKQHVQNPSPKLLPRAVKQWRVPCLLPAHTARPGKLCPLRGAPSSKQPDSRARNPGRYRRP